MELLVALNHLVHGRVAYLTRFEPGVQSPEQTLERGSGSCRHVAWLLVQAARSLGFAARFASGYLIQLAELQSPDAGFLEQMSLTCTPHPARLQRRSGFGRPVTGTVEAAAVARFKSRQRLALCRSETWTRGAR